MYAMASLMVYLRYEYYSYQCLRCKKGKVPDVRLWKLRVNYLAGNDLTDKVAVFSFRISVFFSHKILLSHIIFSVASYTVNIC